MSVVDPHVDALHALQQRLRAMPPVAAMDIAVARLDADGLHLRAPLQANHNDKHNAFGGSLASLMTLAAWGWLDLQLRLAGHVADVYVADSTLRYLAPVYEDLHALAAPQPPQAWTTALETFRQRGKARIAMQAQVVLADGTVAAQFSGRFAMLARAG